MNTEDAISALRGLAMPVVIVGAADARGPCGATATAMYTSLDPVELVVSLVASSRTGRAVLDSRELSVSLLGADQTDLATVMSSRSDADDKWADLGIPPAYRPGSPVPAVQAATAIWGRLVASVPSGDHLLALLRAEHVQTGGPGTGTGALVRLQRRYLPLPEPDAAPDEEHPL